MPIRPATAEDIEGIRRVAKQSWEHDYPDILTRETTEEAVEDWYAPDRLDEELDYAGTLPFVAEREGTIVGFAHATWNDEEDEGYILRLYVQPDARREGVGRELLDRTCAELTARDVDRINAMVLAENEPGNAFYERFGFEQSDESETRIGGETYRERRYVLADETQLAID